MFLPINKARVDLFYIALIYSLTIIFSIKGFAQPACLGEQGKLVWNMWDLNSYSSIDILSHRASFPFKPNRSEILSDFTTPNSSYGSNYASFVRGYLRVPQSGEYTFNVTGDDQTYFYLSTGEDPKNTTRIAYFNGHTGQTEYTKYSTQTSDVVSLIANEYYYFELLHREGGGGDHFRVNWKAPFIMDTEFQTITSQYLFDYTCNLDCPEKGTVCDDNDPNTLNDVQDGYCNCFGTPQPKNVPFCVGEKGSVNILYYDNITGDRLTHLYFDSNYPLQPSRGSQLDELTLYNSEIDNYGSVIKGFLTVPITGTYYFNITGIRRAALKLSATENPEEAVFIAYYDLNSGISTYDHDRESTQTSQGQYLEKGKYYYIEINHKANTNSDYLNIYWKTPFHIDNRWRRLEANYLYQFDPTCEFLCFPEGTPCDDGSSTTTRDTFNANCLCVGIPCPNNDCGDGGEPAAYEAPEDCGVSDELSNSASSAWVSCSDSQNPATNTLGKWIQYDLGQIYYIDSAHVWNYNVSSLTGRGFKNVTVHVSTNGTNWTQIGNFNWSEATGLVGYEGFTQGFGVTGRYILISANSNFDNSSCYGLSKINFAVFDCLNIGQPCDDGNAQTTNDFYNKDCKCVGGGPAIANLCSKETIYQRNLPYDSDRYDAIKTIESQAVVLANNDINYIAGESITFMAGFHAQQGSELLAMIEECPLLQGIVGEPSATVIRPYDIGDLYSFPPKGEEDTTIINIGTRIIVGTPQNLVTDLVIAPNPTKDWAIFEFSISQPTNLTLKVFAANGQEISTLYNNRYVEKGSYQERFQAKNLAKGIYLVHLATEHTVITKNLAVIE